MLIGKRDARSFMRKVDSSKVLDAFYVFITTTFPKAGVALGGLPLTLNLLLTAVVVLRNPNQTVLSVQRYKGFGITYAILLFMGIITLALAVFDQSAFAMSQMIIVLASPLAGVAATRVKPETFAKIIIISLIIVNVYGVIQYAAGLERTSIAGLTYTYGQSLENKTIGYDATTGTATKIPSTYQVGNSLGIYDVLAVSYLLSKVPIDDRWNIARIIAVISGITGLLLCGSRSILIPFVICFIYQLVTFIKQFPAKIRSTIGTFSLFGLIVFAIILFWQRTVFATFWQRNIVDTLNDPTAAGRTDQWSKSFNAIQDFSPVQLLRLVVLGKDSSMHIGGEGLPQFFFSFGVISTMAFYIGLMLVAASCWRNINTRTISLGLMCVVFAFCVDTTYFYPPNAMNFFIFAAAATTMMRDSTVMQPQVSSYSQKQ